MVKSINIKFLKIGKICATRGLKGELKIQNFCDNTEIFNSPKHHYIGNDCENHEKLIEVKLNKFSIHKNFILASFDKICDINIAEKLKNKFIFAKKSELIIPNDRIFLEDLINFQIIDDNSGFVYGTLKSISNAPNNEIYEISDLKNPQKIYYLPILADTLKNFDQAEKKIFVSPIKGIFDNDN